MTTLTMHASRTLFRELGPGDEVLVTGLDHDANVAPWLLAAEDRGVDGAPGRDRSRGLRRRPRRVRRTAHRPHPGRRVRLGVERRRHGQRRRRAVRALPRRGRALATWTRSTSPLTARSTWPPSGATSWSARPTSSSARTSASCSAAPSCSSATAPTRCGPRRTTRRTRGRRARSTSRASPAPRRRSRYLRSLGMDAVAAYERGLAAQLLEGLTGIAGVTVYGTTALDRRVPTAAFNVAGPFARRGVGGARRAGHLRLGRQLLRPRAHAAARPRRIRAERCGWARCTTTPPPRSTASSKRSRRCGRRLWRVARYHPRTARV